MRFIALRCKDTIAPTGTIAQGVGARQVNAHGDIYETKYGLTTSQRVYGTVMENREEMVLAISEQKAFPKNRNRISTKHT